MGKLREEDLQIEKLVSGDSPSIIALGVHGARALSKNGVVVFMTDVLGRVHLMAAKSVTVVRRPRVSDEDLDKLSEDAAISALLAQGDEEAMVIAYLKRREERNEEAV